MKKSKIQVFSWKHCEKRIFYHLQKFVHSAVESQIIMPKRSNLSNFTRDERKYLLFLSFCGIELSYILFIYILVKRNLTKIKKMLNIYSRWFLNVFFCCLSSCQLCLCIWFSKSLLWHTFRAGSCLCYIDLEFHKKKFRFYSIYWVQA